MAGQKTSSVTLVGTGDSDWLALDVWNSRSQLSGYAEVSATATYTIEYTVDNIEDPSVTPVPFATDVAVATATTDFFDSSGPMRALRLSVSASTGSVKLVVLQGATAR